MEKIKNFFRRIFEDFWDLLPARLFLLILTCAIIFVSLFFIDGYGSTLIKPRFYKVENQSGKVNNSLLSSNQVLGTVDDYIFFDYKYRPIKESTIYIQNQEYTYKAYNSYKLEKISYGLHNVSEGYRINFNFDKLNTEKILADNYDAFIKCYKEENPYLFAYDTDDKYIKCINFKDSDIELVINDANNGTWNAFSLIGGENWKKYIDNNEPIIITDVDGKLFTGIISLNLMINLKVEILDKESLNLVGQDINFNNFIFDINTNTSFRGIMIPVTGLSNNDNKLELRVKDKKNRLIISQDEKIYFKNKLSFDVDCEMEDAKFLGIPFKETYTIKDFKMYYVNRDKNCDIEIDTIKKYGYLNRYLDVNVDGNMLKSGFYKIEIITDKYEYLYIYYFEKEGEQ